MYSWRNLMYLFTELHWLFSVVVWVFLLTVFVFHSQTTGLYCMPKEWPLNRKYHLLCASVCRLNTLMPHTGSTILWSQVSKRLKRYGLPSYLTDWLPIYNIHVQGLAISAYNAKIYLQPYNFFQDLTELNIPFHVLLGEPDKVLPDFIKTKEIGGVVTDFTPMRTPLNWLENAAKKLPKNVPVCQVCRL